MMWILFEASINIFQAAIIVYFLNKQLYANRTHKIGDMLCVFGISLWSTLYLFISIPISDITIFFIAFVYALKVYDDK